MRNQTEPTNSPKYFRIFPRFPLWVPFPSGDMSKTLCSSCQVESSGNTARNLRSYIGSLSPKIFLLKHGWKFFQSTTWIGSCKAQGAETAHRKPRLDSVCVGEPNRSAMNTPAIVVLTQRPPRRRAPPDPFVPA